MLGIFASLDARQYHIESNKEAGLGRFDILVAPTDPTQIALLFEIKSIPPQSDAVALTTAAEAALAQIETRLYEKTTLIQHLKGHLKIGIAFAGKQFAIAHAP